MCEICEKIFAKGVKSVKFKKISEVCESKFDKSVKYVKSVKKKKM